MRDRVLGFIGALRASGVPLAVSESMDAFDAVAVVGVDRPMLREALAATLVKDEDDRPLFDDLFDRHFPLPTRSARRPRRRPRAARAPASGVGRRRPHEEGVASGRAPRAQPSPEAQAGRGRRPARGRMAALRRRPLADLDADELAEARAVAAVLGRALEGRVRRRERTARIGRVDLRRTARAALRTEGLPLTLRRRGRRPGRPDLVALADLSGSVASASEVLLALLAAMPGCFRRAELFAYVDHLCPIAIEDGHVAPAGPLDLWARSDFGRVLGELETASARVLHERALLLIMGDGRNNRRPPRVDRLRAVRRRVGRLVWLVPEPRRRWGTGDSALAAYAPCCDAMLECLDLDALARAVRDLIV